MSTGRGKAMKAEAFNTGPFRNLHGGRNVRSAIPWTGDWEMFTAHAALIGLDITDFSAGPNQTLHVPGHLRGVAHGFRLSRDGWLGYFEGSDIFMTWAGEYFRYYYLGGPKPMLMQMQEAEQEWAPPRLRPLRREKPW
jgi:hypothetical protein